MHPENLEAGTLFGMCHGFKVCTGACYLGGYIRDYKSKHNSLKECRAMWDTNVITVSETTEKFTQESYAAVVCAIQSE